MNNKSDDRDLPICPVCDQPIPITESTGHLERYMLHLRCWLVTESLDGAKPADAPGREHAPDRAQHTE
jgi:hypothetical protein